MKKTFIGVIVGLLLTVGAGGYYYFSKDRGSQTPISTTSANSVQKTYEYTFPEQVSSKDFFAGEFVRNDVASIYPRRESLVKDILVDIGDRVVAGQTLAVLFEPGVQGQSASNIGLKSTILDSKQKILGDTRSITEAKIKEINQQIQEKENTLKETIDNLNEKISQTSISYETRIESLRLSLKQKEQELNTLQVRLINAQDSKEAQLEDAIVNTEQKLELLDIEIDEIYTQIVPIIYIGEESEIDYENTSRGDLSQYFSARNNDNLSKLIQEVQSFQSQRYSLDTKEKYQILQNIILYTIVGLENTIYSLGDTDEQEVLNAITKAKLLSTELLNQKQNYDRALSSYEVLRVNLSSNIENIKEDISEKKVEIEQLRSDINLFNRDNSISVTESEKDLATQKLISEIEILKKSKEVLIANENKQITQAQNEVSIAKADLNSEYVASLDSKIISPFTGVISKRNIEIGEMASPSQEVYRISNVDNSLSRITKKEIQFFVPQSTQSNFELGQEVYFYESNESEYYTATIYRIAPEIDEETGFITVQAKVSNDVNLLNKSTIRVSLETESSTYLIPSSSIYNKGERTILYYKKDNGKLGVRDINIISDDGEFSIVSGEIDTNLKVVTTPIFVK